MDTAENIQPKPRTSAADFFLHLGVVVALYVQVISFLNLVFDLITYAFPNQPLSYGIATESITIPVASLIIVVPLYLFLTRLLNRSYDHNPEKKQLWVRKWLIYLTLFIAGLAIATDLIVLVFKFINGDIITVGFLLKVLSVFLVLAAVFSYYLADIRDKIDRSKNKTYALAVGVAVLLVIGLGFFIIGSPAKQRMLKIDQQKVYHLQNIQNEIVSYWQAKQKLPARLEDVEDSLAYFTLPLDPETQVNYEYNVVGPLSFELCATFNLPLEGEEKSKGAPRPAYIDYPDQFGGSFQHEAGRVCFTRTIDPDRYPPFEKTVPAR